MIDLIHRLSIPIVHPPDRNDQPGAKSVVLTRGTSQHFEIDVIIDFETDARDRRKE
jgi:hypothetical protein